MPLNHTMVKMANLMLYFTTLKKKFKVIRVSDPKFKPTE